MILSSEQVIEIILNNPNKDIVNKHRLYSKKLQMHLYGVGLKDALPKIEGLEKASLQQLRVKYASSNKALFALLGRPMDKVFTTKDGQLYTNLEDSTNAKVMPLLGNINGEAITVKKWLKTFWLPHYKDDPGGIILMEMEREFVPGQPKARPTTKASSGIYDYHINGSRLEHLVFELDDKDLKTYGIEKDGAKYYRVIDDLFDKIYRLQGQSVTEVPDQTYNNEFGFVPAMLNSDLIDPMDENSRLSPFDEVLELAHDFMIKSSIKITYDLQLGFPIFWRYEDDCPVCEGTGSNEAEKCKECSGSGKRVNRNISDVTVLRYPDKDQHVVAPNVAGFISPPKEYHEIVVSDLNDLRTMMEFTMWGRAEMPQLKAGAKTDGQKTATEIIADEQPMINRLSDTSEAAERRDKFITDCIIAAETMKPADSSVTYGRGFQIESNNALWEKYETARKNSAPVFILDIMLDEHLRSKYGNDNIGLAIVEKLKILEPFLHKTPEQVKALGVSEEDLKAKIYYPEYYKTLDPKKINISTIDQLKEGLRLFVADKQLPEPAPAMP